MPIMHTAYSASCSISAASAVLPTLHLHELLSIDAERTMPLAWHARRYMIRQYSRINGRHQLNTITIQRATPCIMACHA
jgi:hypothetical protein